MGEENDNLMFIVAIYGANNNLKDIYAKKFSSNKNVKTVLNLQNITVPFASASAKGMVWSKTSFMPVTSFVQISITYNLACR